MFLLDTAIHSDIFFVRWLLVKINPSGLRQMRAATRMYECVQQVLYLMQDQATLVNLACPNYIYISRSSLVTERKKSSKWFIQKKLSWARSRQIPIVCACRGADSSRPTCEQGDQLVECFLKRISRLATHRSGTHPSTEAQTRMHLKMERMQKVKY